MAESRPELKVLTQIRAVEPLYERLIVRRGEDGPPPGFMLDIPADRLFQRRIEVVDGFPAQAAQLRGVQAIAPVVRAASRIADALNERFRLAQKLQEPVRDLDVGPLAVRADV